MLVQFMLRNVLSFKEETILDMTAVSAYKEHQSNLIDDGRSEKLLKVAAIYGANASGKSNIHCAMGYFQNIVARSFNNVDEDRESAISRFYFPFSFDSKEDNSEFEITVIVGDQELQYGFEYNRQMIVSEWMYIKSLDTNRKRMIIERTERNINLGASVRKECEAYKEQIPSETLALSFYNKLKLKTDIFRTMYLAVMSIFMGPTDSYTDTNERSLNKLLPDTIDTGKHKLLEFLNAIDTGITDIRYKRNGEDRNISFYTTHSGSDGEHYSLNLYNESDGTIRSILLYIYAEKAVSSNRVMFVDELNLKLHPLLLKFIIDIFYEKDSRAQLIYTTHDTTLMDKKFFRRDQIWFVQKDQFGRSELTALSEYKVRSDASFEKDYLAGVYGGIPLLKEFDMREGD